MQTDTMQVSKTEAITIPTPKVVDGTIFSSDFRSICLMYSAGDKPVWTLLVAAVGFKPEEI